MSKVNIKPSKASGEIMVPPSKSYAHRLLIAAALSSKPTTVSNIDLSNDIIATINCLKALGKNVEVFKDGENNNVYISDGIIPQGELVFDCLESGSTLRFFIPIALANGSKVKFTGTEKLLSRGLAPYEDICVKQNILYHKEPTSISFEGALKSGEFDIPGNISSQFITGLLFSLPLLDGDSVINVTTTLESSNYIDITLDVLEKAGINIRVENNKYYIKGNQKYSSNNYIVEGDYSNAAFLDALNYLGGEVDLIGLNDNSKQGDKVYQEYFKLLSVGYQELDISNCIDLGPILFAFSSLKHGAKFLNTKRLKIKESNRVQAVITELEKFGAEIIDYDDYVVINKVPLHTPIEILSGQNDHRIVMMLSVMASVYGGEIDGIEAVKKSYPSFFEDLKKLGIEVKHEIN